MPRKRSAAVHSGARTGWPATQLTERFVREEPVQVGDVDRALAAAEYPVGTTPGIKGLAQLLTRALELVAPDSHAAGRLLPLYGRALGVEQGDYPAAQEIWRRALDISQRNNDLFLEMWTLAWAGGVAGLHLHPGEELKNGLKVIELAASLDELLPGSMGHQWVARSLTETGRSEEAESHAKAFLDHAERLRDRSQMAGAFAWNSGLSNLRGDWSAARSFSDRGLVVLPGDPRGLHQRAILEYQQGEFALGQAFLEQLFDTLRAAGHWAAYELCYAIQLIPQVTMITGVAEHFEFAEDAAKVLFSEPAPIPRFVRMARMGLALTAVLQSDSGAADGSMQF